VATLARLCEMLSSWSCWASMPVFEIHSERSMTLNFRSIDTPSSRKLEGGMRRIRAAYCRLILAGPVGAGGVWRLPAAAKRRQAAATALRPGKVPCMFWPLGSSGVLFMGWGEGT